VLLLSLLGIAWQMVLLRMHYGRKGVAADHIPVLRPRLD
jgi:hypothetical protein